VNWAMIIGTVGKKPELKRASGHAFAALSIVTEELFKTATGQIHTKPEHHRIDVFGKQAVLCSYYLGSGSIAMVEGFLRTRKWIDDKDIERETTVIVAVKIQPLDDISSKILEWATTPPDIFSSSDEFIQQIQNHEQLSEVDTRLQRMRDKFELFRRRQGE
jgi:single stranded DNA-binding protein